jgi:hypothetical protein
MRLRPKCAGTRGAARHVAPIADARRRRVARQLAQRVRRGRASGVVFGFLMIAFRAHDAPLTGGSSALGVPGELAVLGHRDALLCHRCGSVRPRRPAAPPWASPACRRRGTACRAGAAAPARLVVLLRRRHERDVQAVNLLDHVVVDLREDHLLLDAERVVATTVERLRARPRKSRIRGHATVTNRSRNSHMRAPRSVTDAPISCPSRRPKLAIDFFALRAPASGR